jgi:hypothetical protein
LEEEMSKEAEGFADDFAGDEVVTGEAPTEKKDPKPVIMLTEDQCNDGAYDAYLGYLTSIVPLQIGLDMSKKWKPDEVWTRMNVTDQRGANKAFKKKGRFGVGGGKETVPKSPAEEKAFGIMKEVRQSMLAHAENNFGSKLQELQELNSANELSIEVYYKGFKAFRAGLPTG